MGSTQSTSSKSGATKNAATGRKTSPLTPSPPAATVPASPPSPPPPPPLPAVEILTCCICLDAALPFITLSPCAHFLCGACALAVADCPQCKKSIASKMHMPQVTQSIEDSLRATGQEVRAYVPFVNRNENVAWRAPVARQQPPPPPPAAAAAVPPAAPAQPVALMPGIPRWVQRMVGTVLRDTNRLDREERNGGGAAVSVETPHQLLQGCIIAAATSYGVYLVATYVLRVAFHAAMLVPTSVYVGVGITAAALVAVSKSQ